MGGVSVVSVETELGLWSGSCLPVVSSSSSVVSSWFPVVSSRSVVVGLWSVSSWSS